MSKTKYRYWGITIFILLGLLHLFIVVYNHYNFRTFAYYYGVYNYAFYDFAHFTSTANPVLFDGRGASFMQDHFSLLLPLLSPLYWFFAPLTGTYTLLIFQWIAILYGAWGTYKYVSFKSGTGWIPLAAMFCYFTMYSRFASYVADCNLAIIGAALVPGLLYFFEARKWRAFWLLMLLILVTREDFSLWLFFVAIYLLITHRREMLMWKQSLMMAGLCLVYFVLVMQIFIPALETPEVKFLLFNYSALGENSLEAVKFMLGNPIESFRLLFVNHLQEPEYDGIKARFYLTTFFSGAFVLLIRPASLICLIPLVAKKMFNDDPIRWDIESYYAIEMASILPLLVFGIISGLNRSRLRSSLAVVVPLAVTGTTVYCFENSTNWHVPYKSAFYKSAFYWQQIPVEELRAELNKIPDDAGVSASGAVIPQLAYRRRITHFPNTEMADYVCINLSGGAWPLDEQALKEELRKLKESGEWEIVWTRDNMAIFRRLSAVN